jgi:hypothetical protein
MLLRSHCYFLIAVLITAIDVAAQEYTNAAKHQDVPALAPVGGTIGYAVTSMFEAIYQTPDGKEECPEGMNLGPRERFVALYPEGTHRPLVETQLDSEIRMWHPSPEDPEEFRYLEAQGPIAPGLNLDGEISPNDFTHPDGTRGVDNQIYRLIGCLNGYRGPDGLYAFAFPQEFRRRDNRLLIEITDVDDLSNDEEVIVSLYRGRDELITDASGINVVAGGSQRIDARMASRTTQQTRGRIVDGVLTTEPIPEFLISYNFLRTNSVHKFRDFRLQLSLTPTRADGLSGAYVDAEAWMTHVNRNISSHHLSAGMAPTAQMNQVIRRLADAYPDPETGENTHISHSYRIEAVQVFIIHPDEEN